MGTVVKTMSDMRKSCKNNVGDTTVSKTNQTCEKVIKICSDGSDTKNPKPPHAPKRQTTHRPQNRESVSRLGGRRVVHPTKVCMIPGLGGNREAAGGGWK